jgi:hypothetical protein
VKLCRRGTSVPSFLWRCDRRRLLLALCLSVALAACTLNDTSQPVEVPPPAAEQPVRVTDVAVLLEGICFEAAHALSGQAFILTSQEQLNGLYNQIDGSELCRRPIARHTFDFAGHTVVGTWTYSPQGCTARHDLVRLRRNDENRVLNLRYRFIVEGDCPYELIRPLWIAVENPDSYNVRLVFAG